MTNSIPGRPAADEYASFYARYVARVPEDDVMEALRGGLDSTGGLLRGVGSAAASSRYALGKWSVKEVVAHVTDTERIFAYRALRFARGDRTPLPGFEQDGYVTHAAADDRDLDDLTAEFEIVRRSTVALFAALPAAAWHERGIASDREISVRALAFIIAGHERHHAEVLKTKYLAA